MSLRCTLLLIGAFLMSGTAHGTQADLQAQLLTAIGSRDPAAVRAALDAGADPNIAADFGAGRLGGTRRHDPDAKMLRAAATSDALYLAMPRWVVAAHPPLLIRWSELRVVACRYGMTNEVLLDLEAGKPVVGRIFLRGGVAASVLEKVDPARSACETEKK